MVKAKMRYMKTCFGRLIWAAPLLVVALLTGCVTSTVQSRKQEKLSAYEALSPETRALVDEGRIKIGMTSDAVFIAWGKPGEITEGESGESGHTTTWTYYGTYLVDTPIVGWRRVYYESYSGNYIRAKVLFANGAVKEWQTYPVPGY